MRTQTEPDRNPRTTASRYTHRHISADGAPRQNQTGTHAPLPCTTHTDTSVQMRTQTEPDQNPCTTASRYTHLTHQCRGEPRQNQTGSPHTTALHYTHRQIGADMNPDRTLPEPTHHCLTLNTSPTQHATLILQTLCLFADLFNSKMTTNIVSKCLTMSGCHVGVEQVGNETKSLDR